MAIAIERGISITRWQRSINVMLEKDPGQPQISRLRIIHLFEADFNFFLKVMWGSRLVRRATNDGMIKRAVWLSTGQHCERISMFNQDFK
jgi:hypothetical protein